jgi:predicted TIM-barrel fold metal-dependent hydrolase
MTDLSTLGPARKVFDTDVHHGMWEPAALFPYLDRVHRDRLNEYGFGGGGGYAANGGERGYRADLFEDDRRPTYPGVTVPDARMCQRQLLDGAGVDIALLGGGGGIVSATSGTDTGYANTLMRAFNDYSVEEWLTVDDRFRLAIAINPQDPLAAAEEIDRLGPHPQVVSVMLPCGATRPFGNPFYRAIHTACARNGLVITLHFGAEGSGVNPPPSAAGWPTTFVESRLMRPSFYAAHLSSFVFEGVFEAFPTLRVAMVETAFAWIPAHLWRMDSDWKALRAHTPWVKRLPSEYVFDHVRFSSQPLDEPSPRGAMAELLGWVRADRTLMFSSDYPHFDWDDPGHTFNQLAPQLRSRILWDNAAELYGVD